MSRGHDRRIPNPGEDDEMGRGRQRAKDAKMARQLKYANNGSDLRALERELVAGRSDGSPSATVNDPDPDNPVNEWDGDDDDWDEDEGEDEDEDAR